MASNLSQLSVDIHVVPRAVASIKKLPGHDRYWGSLNNMEITSALALDVASFTNAVVSASRRFGGIRPWWRGHRDCTWSLVPSIYRNGLAEKEVNLNGRFRLMARARRAACPDSSDPMSWLFLMQHYRLPTRLLDWSQSPLVALFFALEKPDDADAVLWALSPTRLNGREAQTESICMPDSTAIKQLGVQAFGSRKTQRDERVLAVLTEESDPRHMVQQSAFTIHGRDEPLDTLTEADRFLMRITVPAAAKHGLRQLLDLYGVTRATLFPDLENLALDLARLDFSDESGVRAIAEEPPVAS